MAGINVGSVSVDVVPNVEGLRNRVNAATKGMQATVDIDARVNKAIAKVKEITKDQSAAIDLRVTGADKIRAEIQGLRDFVAKKQLEIQMTNEEARRKIAEIDEQISALNDDVALGLDTKGAEAEIRRLTLQKREIRIQTSADTAPMKAEVAAAAAEMGKKSIDLRLAVQLEGEARAKAKLDALARSRRMTLGIDVDSSRVQRLYAVILALGPALIPIAAVGVGAFAALGAAAASAAIGIGVMGLALSGIGSALTRLGAAHRTAAADAIADGRAHAAAAAQIAAAQSSLTGARAGLANARASGSEGAASAARAVADAQRGVTRAVQDAARAQQAAADQVASAQRALGDSERALASAERDELDAQRDLIDARKAAKEAAEDLNNNIADGILAERGAKLAVQETAQALAKVAPSWEAVERAMGSLVDAQDELVKVTRDPRSTAAQKEAAQLAVDAAQAKVDGANQTSQATKLENDQAALAHDEAVQRLREIQLNNTRLAADKKKSDADGIAGSDQVVAAQARIRDATQATADAERNVADARKGVGDAVASQVQAQVDGAQSIVDAQRAVGDAVTAQTAQQRQSAASIASAQRGVADAQRNLGEALSSSMTAGTAATRKYQQALEGLTPSQRRFVLFLDGLRPKFAALKEAAAKGFLGGLTDALKSITPDQWQGIIDVVTSVSNALGDLARDAAKALNTPLFKRFFAQLGKDAGPNVKLFGEMFGNLIKGFAGLSLAFKPIVGPILKGIGRLFKSFADFGQDAANGKSSQFNKFLGFIKENGPKVAHLFGVLFGAAGKLLEVLAPLGVAVMGVVDAVLSFIAGASPDTLAKIAGGLGAVLFAVVAFKIISGAGSPLGLLVTMIFLLATGLVYAYKHSEKFRKALAKIGHFFKIIGKAIGRFFGWVAKKTVDFLPKLKRAWDRIKDIFLHPVENAKKALHRVIDDIQRRFTNIKNYIVTKFKEQWNKLRDQMPAPVQKAMDKIGDLVGKIKQKFIDIKDWVVTKFKNAWAVLTETIQHPVQTAKDAIAKLLSKDKPGLRWVFQQAVNGIGVIWLGLQELVKAPIRFVIDTVLNDGLISAWNWLVDKLKLPGMLRLEPIPMPAGLARGFDRGGWTGPGSKMQPAGIVHADEFVVNKTSRRRIEQTDPGLLDHINRTGKLPGYDQGGLVGDLPGYSIGGWVKNKVSSVLDGIANVAGMLLHPKRTLQHLLDLAYARGGGILEGPVGNILKAIPTKIIDSIADKVRGSAPAGDAGTGTGSAPYTGPVGPAAASLRAAGLRYGANPIVRHEDPQNGPAYDFMIGMQPGNALAANLVAHRDEYGVRYVIHNMRIWSPVNWGGRPYTPIRGTGDFQHIYHVHASYGPEGSYASGYANGTMSARPGYAWVGERGPELMKFKGGERVYNTNDSRKMHNGQEYHISYGDVHVENKEAFFKKQESKMRHLTAMANMRGGL